MATQLELNLELKCSTDGSVTQKTVRFAPVPPTIAELKQRLENGFSVPKSCLTLCLPDGQALLDTEQIANLYLRDGDTLHVTYFAVADVHPLRRAIERAIRPVLELLRANSALENAKEMQKNPDSTTFLTLCQNAIFEIAHKGVYPWDDFRSEANRRYLLQEGLLDVILEMYAILLPLPWNERGHPLQNLEISCLTFLWNFSETNYVRQLVVDKGGFDMMLKSILHQTVDEVLAKSSESVFDIFDVVTGCLSNYSELHCCQIAVAKNALVLQRLLQFALRCPLVNTTTKKSIANVFFGLTHDQDVHQYLVTRDVLEPFVQFSENQAVTIRYVLGFSYAKLVLFSLNKLPQEFLKPITDAMKVFLLKVGPDNVKQVEERIQDNWITMLPFLQAMYSYGVETVKYSDACLHKTQPYETFTEKNEMSSTVAIEAHATSVSLAYVLFSLLIELSRANMTRLLIKQGLLEYITMLPWGLDKEWHTQCQWVHENVRKTNKLPVPSLSSIAKGKLARINKEYSGQIAT